jgi:hypothetical protein
MRNSAGWTSSTLANFPIIASPANAEPAEAERADDVLGHAVGERIWPEHFGADHFTPFKHHPRTWAALHQQRPAPEEGDDFKADWLCVVERIPPNLRTQGAPRLRGEIRPRRHHRACGGRPRPGRPPLPARRVAQAVGAERVDRGVLRPR